jgi:tRNA A-37 threonylcarbamoyl transferase component Bud32
MKYEEYFQQILPGILKNMVRAFEAIRFLHINGFKHGDIRNDHIIINRDNGNYVWIDFDYDYEATENPFGLDIFGLGNILIYVIGKGFHNLAMISSDRRLYGDLYERVEPQDFSILHKWRFINLRKLYPIIPKLLNDILLHFSQGADIYYEAIEEVIEDMDRCLYTIFD